MKRFRLFEFEDLPWFPDVIRQGGTDYLRYFLSATNYYSPVVPLISEVLDKTGESQIIDLCSGGGGAAEGVFNGLRASGKPVAMVVTDLFPNVNAYKYLKKKTKGNITYTEFPVDATNVPNNVKGVRTIFSAIHHFEPETIKLIIKNSIDTKSGICIFDGGDKNIFTILGIILFHPLGFFFGTLFFRPFKISRIIFTYILPLIPLYTIWDGCVSILRLYKPDELLEFAQEADNAGSYHWQSGVKKNKAGMNVSYLIGYPKKQT